MCFGQSILAKCIGILTIYMYLNTNVHKIWHAIGDVAVKKSIWLPFIHILGHDLVNNMHKMLFIIFLSICFYWLISYHSYIYFQNCLWNLSPRRVLITLYTGVCNKSLLLFIWFVLLCTTSESEIIIGIVVARFTFNSSLMRLATKMWHASYQGFFYDLIEIKLCTSNYMSYGLFY